jgi:hypothetical protein
LVPIAVRYDDFRASGGLKIGWACTGADIEV